MFLVQLLESRDTGVILPLDCICAFDMEFCLTSLILCCNCFLLANTELCSARNLFVAAADGNHVCSFSNNSITKRLCLLKVRLCEVDSLVLVVVAVTMVLSSAVEQGDVGGKEADSGVFCIEFDRLRPI